jgi:adenosylcobinamide kinase/adenosylcobinamide-phosphate guanylyltransferase
MAAAGHVLVLGGQRSGKSRFAEELVAASGREAIYVATATAGDGEMAERIAHHRARRGAGWRTVEEPLALVDTLVTVTGPRRAVLVECLTLWVANLMAADRDLQAETGRLVAALGIVSGAVVLVSNEVGSGIIPDNALARRYADVQGTLNRRVAETVGRVILVAAGQPVLLKPAAQPEIVL